MYYMTGDPFHAREALRLAFPDDRAMAEITEIDGERIENKDEPLSGPYHYNAHMMILYWDLIEESPVFTDDERLRVTNAFAAQFGHAQDQGARRRVVENVRRGASGFGKPPYSVGSRHGQWSAISLYCLGRYFQQPLPQRALGAIHGGGQVAFRIAASPRPGWTVNTTICSGTIREWLLF